MHYFEPDDFEYKEPIWFHIPAIFDTEVLFPFQSSFYNYLIHFPYKRKNVNYTVYGCPCSCIWNGGRFMHEPVYRIETIAEMFFNYINNLGMDIQLTMTNRLIEERDLYDRLGNALLGLASRDFSNNIEILVSSDILMNHIRENYPNLKLVRSMTKATLLNPGEEDIYDKIVLPKWNNHDMDLIGKLQQKVELEILCDEPCVVNCPRKSAHYEAYNKSQLFQYTNDNHHCDQQEHPLYNKLWILPDEINYYINLGVKCFKLSGREEISHMIESISMYCIQNDKQYEFRTGAYRMIASKISKDIQQEGK